MTLRSKRPIFPINFRVSAVPHLRVASIRSASDWQNASLRGYPKSRRRSAPILKAGVKDVLETRLDVLD